MHPPLSPEGTFPSSGIETFAAYIPPRMHNRDLTKIRRFVAPLNLYESKTGTMDYS